MAMIKKVPLLLSIFFISGSVYAFPFYADEIVDYNSGTGLDFTGDEHIPRALGPWDLVFVTIGETGYMTFSFDNLFLVDGAGNDVRIYTTGHSIFNEYAEISASMDGINFSSLGILDPNRPSTFVASGPSYDIYFEEFDLSVAGINKARYVRVNDLSGGFVATDLDAVAILNSNPIPEPMTLSSCGLGIILMFFLARRRQDYH